MKIALITTRFFPHVGGVEAVVQNLAEQFAKNHKVSVISSIDSKEFSKLRDKIFNVELPEIQRKNYINKRLWMNLPGSILGYIIFPYRFIYGLYKLISYLKKFSPDIINYHFPDGSSIYIWAVVKYIKKPLIINIHGNDLHVFSKNFFLRFFIKKLLHSSKKIIVNSNYMKSEFSSRFQELTSKVEVIPNGLDINIAQNIKLKKYFDTPYIFYVGRFVHKKGVDLLIEAYKKANISNLKMVLEGKGEELELTKKLVGKYNLDEKIKFTDGNLTADDKFAIMKGALFGVVPSRIEPFGIVALEFLSAGVPLIVSKTGGLIDILYKNNAALFFENGNSDSLSDKIIEMNNNEDLRKSYAKKGLELVENYSWDKISDKYINFFEKII